MTIYAGEYLRIGVVAEQQLAADTWTTLPAGIGVTGDITIWDAAGAAILSEPLLWDADNSQWYYDWATNGRQPGRYLVRARFTGPGHRDSWEYSKVTLKPDQAPGATVYLPGWRLKTGFAWDAPVAILVENDAGPINLVFYEISAWARPHGATGPGTLQLSYNDSSSVLAAGKIYLSLEAAATAGLQPGLWDVELAVTPPGGDREPSDTFLLLVEEGITP